MTAEEHMANIIRLNRQRLDAEEQDEADVENTCRAVVDGLIEARKKRKLSQNQTSKLAGISQRGVNMIENGTRSPSLRSVIKMARGLDVTVVMGEAGQIGVYLGAVEVSERD